MNEAALRTIITMTLTGSIVALLLIVIKPLIKNRLPKSVQYYVWLIVIAAFLIPFSKLIVLPTPITNLPVANISEAVQQYVITVEEEIDRVQSVQAQNGFDEQRTEEATSPLSTGVTILLIIWPFAALVCLGINLFSYLVFVRKLRRSYTEAMIEETSMLMALSKQMRPPALFRSRLAPTPMLIGLFRPIIILPDREYTEAQLKNVLLHELTHLRHHDIIIKWLSVVAKSLHWFNPLIYYVCHEIDRACELSCDEAVIKNLDTDGKQGYGDTLIEMVADTKAPKTVLSTAMCGGKRALKERLGAIMKQKRFSIGTITVSCALVITVLFGTVVLGAHAKSVAGDTNGSADYIGETFMKERILSGAISGDFSTDRYIIYDDETKGFSEPETNPDVFSDTAPVGTAIIDYRYRYPFELSKKDENGKERTATVYFDYDFSLTNYITYAELNGLIGSYLSYFEAIFTDATYAELADEDAVLELLKECAAFVDQNKDSRIQFTQYISGTRGDISIAIPFDRVWNLE